MKDISTVTVKNKESSTEIMVDGKRIPYITEYALNASESSNFVDITISLKIPQHLIEIIAEH